MTAYKTPGVYVEERSFFPPSIEQVATAWPAFIGFTRIAQKQTPNDLVLTPCKISSLAAFETYFGAPEQSICLTVMENTAGGYTVRSSAEPIAEYLLYYSVAMFFANGGRTCSIISVGADTSTTPDRRRQPAALKDLQAGLAKLAQEDEPTLIVIPEAVLLPPDHFQTLVRAVLKQCGTLKDRFAIFDLYDGGLELDAGALQTNRDYFGDDFLQFGAAYYPFLKVPLELGSHPGAGGAGIWVAIMGADPLPLATVQEKHPGIHAAVTSKLQDIFLMLPPSGAIAGVYCNVDQKRGVWEVPANVNLRNLRPAVAVNRAQQELFHVNPVGGKSINVICEFPGRGTLVWGGRTLAGNDNEWRYISVRRFFIMVEESIKQATRWVVFEPNDANTWVRVRTIIENFLAGLWRHGALAGEKPEHAFYVRCGQGSTMIAQDILQGRLIIEIGLAAVRPAEFVIIRIAHSMQE
jgi:phage tail sheath protein FI